MLTRNRLMAAMFLSAIVAYSPSPIAADDDRSGTVVKSGDSVNLFKLWPKLAQAPRDQLATIEFFVRPDTKAIARPRSFILILSDRRGQNTAGVSLTMRQGTIRASVLGTILDAKTPLAIDRWTHVALTIDPKTVNKQARLWIDGQLVADKLVLERWPTKFEVANLFSDYWNQGRVFSGQIGDVRISRVVRYRADFSVPILLKREDATVLHFAGAEISLNE